MGKKSKESKTKPTAGLIESNGDLSKKFKVVLHEVFERFDADKDGALNYAELQAFSTVAGHGALEPGDMKSLAAMFSVDAQGSLTKIGFEQMFVQQTKHDIHETLRDLAKLGYSRDLEPLEAAGSPTGAAQQAVGVPPAPAPMDELRAALGDLKLHADCAAAHRRVGAALKAMGRDEAAQKSLDQAAALEQAAAGAEAAAASSSVEEQD